MPSYKISPFSTNDININYKLPISTIIDEYFDQRFNSNKYYYTKNGRHALNIALSTFNLKIDDVVTILTTSNNYYISSCVTKEIELFCKWNREVTSKTKVIIVNHEFGYPYNALNMLKKYNIPIIEDCAHTFFSVDDRKLIGTIGDFVIYSFPKMFPIQIGGLLKVNNDKEFNQKELIDDNLLQYIKKVLSHYILKRNIIIKKRLINCKMLTEMFNELGLYERFKLKKGIIPGVFLFKTDNILGYNELCELKKYYYRNGVQCSVFYGENAFFLPVHHRLSNVDLNYYRKIIAKFLLG